MGSVVGDILPFAVGMAVFPIPIIAVILLLFSPSARTNGLAFVFGWVAGVLGLTLLFALLADRAGASSDRNTFAMVSALKLALGLGLLFLAYRQWRSRPAPGQEAEMPGWMRKIDGFTAGHSLRLGLLLTAGNPKNIILAGGGGSTIGQSGLPAAQQLTAVLVFTALASLTTAGPVFYYLWNRERATALLDEVKRWLIQNSAAVMTVVLLVLAAVLIGNGIRGLSS